MKLTPEEQAIIARSESIGDGIIRPHEKPATALSRGKFTPEEQQIHDAADGIIRPRETESDLARDRREAIERATESILGEEPYEGEMSKVGWKYCGGVAAGMQFVLRDLNPYGCAVPAFVMTAPMSFDETQSYANYTLVVKRNPEGQVTAIMIEVDHRQQYSSQFTPEQCGVQVPKALRGQLTEQGKKMVESLAKTGAVKPSPRPEPKDAPKLPMPTTPFPGLKPKK